MSQTLDAHVSRDPRILSVYREARRRYAEKNLTHHNFAHVMRDLYRALDIAEDEPSVNHGVLIPGVLLHDIGFCNPEFRRLGHDVAGARLAKEILSPLGYDKNSSDAICHCILAHKGHAAHPQSLEAKILYDADVLEKAGLVCLLFGGKIIHEFQETVDDFLQRECDHRSAEITRGFYTSKAGELDCGRLERIRSLLTDMKKEITGERPEFSIVEQDLWRGDPPA